MTSPNFGENFQEFSERVVVQIELWDSWQIPFKEIKLRRNNYANNSTDNRNVFMRGYISPIIFLESYQIRLKKEGNSYIY